jgi:hypothetical protein
MALTQEAFFYLAVTIFSFIFCYLAWQRRLVKSAWELCLLTMMTGLWAFTLFCESIVQSVEIKVLWVKVSYTFVTTCPVFYLLFVLKFTDKTSFKNWYQQVFLFVVPFVTILLTWTNDTHQLVWTGWEPLTASNELLHFHRGIWFWVGILLYSYLMLFFSTWHLVRFLLKHKAIFGKARTTILLIGSMTPWLTSILFYIGLNHPMASWPWTNWTGYKI